MVVGEPSEVRGTSTVREPPRPLACAAVTYVTLGQGAVDGALEELGLGTVQPAHDVVDDSVAVGVDPDVELVPRRVADGVGRVDEGLDAQGRRRGGQLDLVDVDQPVGGAGAPVVPDRVGQDVIDGEGGAGGPRPRGQ